MSDQSMIARYYSTSQPMPRVRKHRVAERRLIGIASLVWLLVTLCVSWLLFWTSESMWLGTLLTFAPRSLLVIPGVCLFGVSLWRCRRIAPINAVAVVIVLWPIMDWHPVWNGESTAAEGTQLVKIVSCNVQGFAPRFDEVVREISRRNPDVICFQEARGSHSLLETMFGEPDWHTIWLEEYWVASRYPLRLVQTCETEAFQRVSAVHVVVESPEGDFDLVNVHLMTARRGIEEVSLSSVLSGDGLDALESQTRLRRSEAEQTRLFIENSVRQRPHFVVGDFNMPECSSIYNACFGDYKNGFAQAGVGYGYTSPCNTSRFWPSNTPWLRIDHLLASKEWDCRVFQTGESAGSDHRLVAATWIKAR